MLSWFMVTMLVESTPGLGLLLQEICARELPDSLRQGPRAPDIFLIVYRTATKATFSTSLVEMNASTDQRACRPLYFNNRLHLPATSEWLRHESKKNTHPWSVSALLW
ncbi:hypothetical protein BDV41DRAFT_17 [Aspergillus transmontanensis]|uniref:Secreted protein n=1 Tax=Aspergillus transmontanensis TaxID=1034304 RepID=A0A5N6WHG1_9EURO|nr:hypothetical protein BDV41DRAFT_17 [Aspergillus transmontanensis]